MGKTISCVNCGGSFDDELPQCPYCGSGNIKGAEKVYMEKLEDVRENLEELDRVPTEELQIAVRKQAGRLRIVLLCIGAVALLFTVVFLIMNRSEDRDYKAEYLWQQEHYPEMNALYESGDYDALEELMYTLSEDENANLLQWEHEEFMSDYIMAKSVLHYIEMDKEEPLSENSMAGLFYDQWKIKGITLRQEDYSEQEYEALLPYIELSEADFAARWKLTEEEYGIFSDNLAENRNKYISFEQAEAFIEKWVKENR